MKKLYISFLSVFLLQMAVGQQINECSEYTYSQTIESVINPLDSIVEEHLLRMSVNEKIGQLFIGRIPGAHAINNATRALITDYHIGGFILFAANVSSIEQVQRLTASLQAASPVPLFIAIDEEGGRVSRIRTLFNPRIGTAYSIARSGNSQDVYDSAKTIAERLQMLGVNMNFAPVADIWSNPANTVIGDRAYGREPEITGEMTAAAVRGFRDTGIISVVKHFPGHGDTNEDSHYMQAVYSHNVERFDSVESYPFRRGIKAGADGVMIGHISTPQMHPETPALPAVFSTYWIQDILRNGWRYDGLIITDALDMGGLTRYYSGEEIVINSFLAGVDILLMPANIGNAVDAIRKAYDEGIISDERLNESVRRILRVKFNKFQ